MRELDDIDEGADGETRQDDEAQGEHRRRVDEATFSGDGELVQDHHGDDEERHDGDLTNGCAIAAAMTVPVASGVVFVVIAIDLFGRGDARNGGVVVVVIRDGVRRALFFFGG